MKIIKILPVLLVFPAIAFGASRGDSTARVGMSRGSQAGARASVTAADVKEAQEKYEEEISSAGETATVKTISGGESSSGAGSSDCRENYRKCMDEFCLLDESQGERCACSDNIERAKSKIKAVLDIQAEADKLYTEGVEREQLGAKAKLVFTDTKNTSTKVTSVNFLSWLNGDLDGEEDVGEDVELGDILYQEAAKYCASELDSCKDKAEMEEMLYSRMITQDCKNYDAYLADQKLNAESNKRTAESAVRKARLEMLDTTNKYNRGECLLAYRSCIADKGGCGSKFENCLDESLLKRRSNACDNILDQCMAVRDYVVKDWAEESKSVLEEAAKYADTNKRGTCLAKAQNCLEESCSTSTNAECLEDVNVAAGICPIITECDDMIPGFQAVVNDKLGFLRTKFCENDIDKCLQDKCGVDFTKPECVGKKPYEIAALCPQDMFPSCKNAEQYDVIVQSAILQMDYQMLQGCINYFGEQLGKVCGTDMACLPTVSSAASFTKVPKTEDARDELLDRVIADSNASVDEFFKQFEQEKTVSACLDSQSGDASKKVKGKTSLADSVFGTAKMLAKMSAQQRNIRAMDSRISELSRQEDLDEAKKNCLTTYKPEKKNTSKSNYTYIKSVSFEPDLRNCHVCRMQQVCETGGESKATSALKAAAGGLSAGAATGTMINAGWGTAIGGVVGAVGAGVLGAMSGGKEEFCQEIESCEDINM
nr:hypothetical protein [Candidatus Enterousia merdequi]